MGSNSNRDIILRGRSRYGRNGLLQEFQEALVLLLGPDCYPDAVFAVQLVAAEPRNDPVVGHALVNLLSVVQLFIWGGGA